MKKQPIGIIVLVIFSIVSALFYLYGVFSQLNFLMGIPVHGAGAIIISIVFMLIYSALAWGLYHLVPWAFTLALAVYSYKIIESIFSLIFANKMLEIMEFAPGVLSVFFLGTMALMGVYIWYVWQKRSVFFKGKDQAKHVDKPFLWVVLGMTILIGIMMFTLTYNYLSLSVEDMVEISQELQEKDLQASVEFCSGRHGKAMDNCLYVSAELNFKQPGVYDVCGMIEDENLRDSCMIMAVAEHKDPDVCEIAGNLDNYWFCHAMASGDADYCLKMKYGQSHCLMMVDVWAEAQ